MDKSKRVISKAGALFKPGIDLEEELENFLALTIGFHLDEDASTSSKFVKVTIEIFEEEE